MIASYSVACRREELRTIREQLGEALAFHGVTGLERDQIILAVDEACANAIIHGNDADENRKIRVEAELRDAELTVRVRDVGEFEFRPSMIDKDISWYVKNRMRGGLGLKLIHAIMDEVRFEKDEDAFVCVMIKKIGEPAKS